MKRSLQKYYMRAKRAQKQSVNDSCLNSYEIQSQSELQPGKYTSDCAAETYETESNSSVTSSVTGSEDFHFENNINGNSTIQLENVESSAESKPLRVRIAEWAVKYNIPNNATNDLLKILHDEVTTPLPLDARTLLRTVRSVEVKTVAPGKYYHFGLKQAVEDLINCLHLGLHVNSHEQKIELYVHVDGLPLAKSSSSQVYPILISIVGSDTVRMVGIYHGLQKPDNLSAFLQDFVEDTIDAINNGISLNNKHYEIIIKGFICDTPAKSFIKNVKGHAGYSSCTKCWIQGEYENKMYFPEIENLHLRTDDQFRLQQDEDHHLGRTSLENIPRFDMIDGFPLDYMHLVCLGITRKLLNLLCNGKPNTKIPFSNICSISSLLMSLSASIPLEFNRKPRSLSELQRWKATEFRQILFYTGPIVLKKFLSHDRYLNFLTLHIAMIILSSSRHKALLDYAAELLKYFVKTFQTLYGITNTSHNVHNLLHLVNDVRSHGSVENFSAFKYENFLQSILKSLRKYEKPLQQIVKRYSEQILVDQKQEKNNYPIFKDSHTDGPVPPQINNDFVQFKSLIFHNFTMKIQPPNNCCCLKNKDIIIVDNIIKFQGSYSLLGRKYVSKSSFYTNPCESFELNIFKTHDDYLSPEEIFDGNDVDYKCVKLKFEDSVIIMPLLHCE